MKKALKFWITYFKTETSELSYKIKHSKNKILFLTLILVFWKPYFILWKLYTFVLILYAAKNWILFFTRRKLHIKKPIFVGNPLFILRLSNALTIRAIENLKKSSNIYSYIIGLIFIYVIGYSIISISLFIRIVDEIVERSGYNPFKDIYINLYNLLKIILTSPYYAFYKKFYYLEL